MYQAWTHLQKEQTILVFDTKKEEATMTKCSEDSKESTTKLQEAPTGIMLNDLEMQRSLKQLREALKELAWVQVEAESTYTKVRQVVLNLEKQLKEAKAHGNRSTDTELAEPFECWMGVSGDPSNEKINTPDPVHDTGPSTLN